MLRKSGRTGFKDLFPEQDHCMPEGRNSVDAALRTAQLQTHN